MFAGTPDQVYRADQAMYDHVGGFGHLLIMGQAGFLEHDETVHGIQMFAREVYPRLKEAFPDTAISGVQQERVVAYAAAEPPRSGPHLQGRGTTKGDLNHGKDRTRHGGLAWPVAGDPARALGSGASRPTGATRRWSIATAPSSSRSWPSCAPRRTWSSRSSCRSSRSATTPASAPWPRWRGGSRRRSPTSPSWSATTRWRCSRTPISRPSWCASARPSRTSRSPRSRRSDCRPASRSPSRTITARPPRPIRATPSSAAT